MEQARDRAIQRVLHKLSAMRATLGEQEQQILDALIVGEAEVEAHVRSLPSEVEARKPGPDEARAHVRSLTDAEARKPEPEVRAHMRKEFQDTEARTPEPDEARAHMRKEFIDSEARTPKPDEARAHARTQSEAEARVNAARRPAPSLRVVFDPASGEYRLI